MGKQISLEILKVTDFFFSICQILQFRNTEFATACKAHVTDNLEWSMVTICKKRNPHCLSNEQRFYCVE